MYKTTLQLWWLLRQGFTYLLLLIGVPVWYGVSGLVRDIVTALGGPITTAGETTANLAENVSQLRDSLRGIAVVGPELSKPFIPLQRALEDASTQTLSQLEVVDQIANFVFWIVFLVPVVALIWVYVVPRIQEAIAAFQVNNHLLKSQSMDLLALRAVTKSDIHELCRIVPDPAAAWREGDPAVLEQLARLELQRYGLQLKRAARS